MEIDIPLLFCLYSGVVTNMVNGFYLGIIFFELTIKELSHVTGAIWIYFSRSLSIFLVLVSFSYIFLA